MEDTDNFNTSVSAAGSSSVDDRGEDGIGVDEKRPDVQRKFRRPSAQSCIPFKNGSSVTGVQLKRLCAGFVSKNGRSLRVADKNEDTLRFILSARCIPVPLSSQEPHPIGVDFCFCPSRVETNDN